jgi:hypothetical protein
MLALEGAVPGDLTAQHAAAEHGYTFDAHVDVVAAISPRTT